jgi:hypothetical protein
VLEVGGGACRSSKRRRIEWPSPRGEEKDARDTAAKFEASRVEIPMRQPIAREVQHWPEEERRESRPARRAGGSARRHVKSDDQGCRREQMSARSSGPIPRVWQLPGRGQLGCGRRVLQKIAPWLQFLGLARA